MEIEQKAEILRGFDTKNLIAKLHQYEDELLKAMVDEADFTLQNRGYLGTGDCQEVKKILLELTSQAPETNDSGKKTTIADKENWLKKQRDENEELSKAITKQREIAFLVEDYRIKVEITKKRLGGISGVLALKTAQINFLASG